MRPITKKHSGGHDLDKAHTKPPLTSADATSRWDSFKHKATVQKSLLDEQYGLCCYSELRADLEGIGYHIEHVRPKSVYPQTTFDYTNLAVSALSSNDQETFKNLKEEIFGGHAKANNYDPTLFISCHDGDCDRYFAYLSDGRVVPTYSLNPLDKDRADHTINSLNLNSPFLVNRRRRWYAELVELFEEHINKDWSLEHLLIIHLIPDHRRLSQFFSVTKQFFGNRAEQVIQQHLSEFI